MDDLAVHVRQAIFAAIVAEGESLMIKSEEIQDGGVEVVDVDAV